MRKDYIDVVESIINGDCKDPHIFLGMHVVDSEGKKQDIAVRAYYSNAKFIELIDVLEDTAFPMTGLCDEGIFETIFPNRNDIFEYKLKITDYSGNSFVTYDPYSFWPVLSEYDIHLYSQGNHHRIFDKLGSHIMTINNVAGTLFSVWAPCARRVSVIGDFNQWDSRRHQMRQLGSSGVWEIFIPLVSEGDLYKFEVKSPAGTVCAKSDPYAYYSEIRPNKASIVHNIGNYVWSDEDWLAQRAEKDVFSQPLSIYELHLGTWCVAAEPDEKGDSFLNYRTIADRLIPYIKYMGYTHVELLPITEHPYDGSWGYQVTGYYAVTSRYGTPQDFMYFVDQCHQNGIGVILDWVPAHFPKDANGLARFDGTAVYEHSDPRQGENTEWGTLVFNHGRLEVRNFLVSNAVFWFEKYHIDGLRVDAVASMIYLDFLKEPGQWIPNKYGGNMNLDAVEFLKQLNTTVFSYFKGIMMIAEESSSWPMITKPPYLGGLGFTFKWNMGWMNDFLKYVSMDPIFRRYSHNNITFSLMYAFTENFILVLSHDEVVHGKLSLLNKMPGDYWQKFAGLRVTYGYTYGHPGKKLLFMGSEFGQFIEWNEYKGLDWHLLDFEMHKKMQTFVRDLNKLYTSEKALYQLDFSYNGFEWIDCNDNEHSVISFMRKGTDYDDILIFVCNFTPAVNEGYCIGAPFDLDYQLVLNSNYEKYGGYDIDAENVIYKVEQEPLHGRPCRLRLNIPPLSVMVFRPLFKEQEVVVLEE
ncbi:MAG TPA: 1,4-alpha-glucan branching protein GlgB [Ruminiclostridium sp.]